MTVPGLKQITSDRDRLRIRYAVIGGRAIALQRPVTTGDGDVLVASGSYFPTLDALDGSPIVKGAERSPRMATVALAHSI